MYLRDLAIWADAAIVDRYKDGFVQRFHRESLSVTEAFLAEISGQIVTDGIAKIGLTFTDELSSPPDLSPGRCFYPWPFDFAAYVAAESPVIKQCMILGALTSAVLQIADFENSPAEPLRVAAERLIARNFVFTGCLKKSWPSPDQHFRARIEFDWKLDKIDLTAVLCRNRSPRELLRVRSGSAIPAEGILHDIAAHSRWKSARRFSIEVGDFMRQAWVADFKEAMRDS